MFVALKQYRKRIKRPTTSVIDVLLQLFFQVQLSYSLMNNIVNLHALYHICCNPIGYAAHYREVTLDFHVEVYSGLAHINSHKKEI